MDVLFFRTSEDTMSTSTLYSISLFLVFSAASAALITHTGVVKIDGINHRLIHEVNAKQDAWVAAPQPYFEGKSMETIKKLMGAKIDQQQFESLEEVSWEAELSSGLMSLPTNFDSRTNWKGCVGDVLDQGDCGSCWAFGAVETVSDRYCIAKMTANVNASFIQLAPLDLITCDGNEGGCHGGDLAGAMNYIKNNGLVTEKCRPYLRSQGGPIPTCKNEPCLKFVNTPQCKVSCHNDEMNYFGDKNYPVQKVYRVKAVADTIAAEIMKNGPVEAAMTVYEDFLNYKSGVYAHTTGQALGGHAIKIIGFGVEDGKDYWLVQNSWTTKWGDDGLFKIARGTDESGIESNIVTVNVAVSSN